MKAQIANQSPYTNSTSGYLQIWSFMFENNISFDVLVLKLAASLGLVLMLMILLFPSFLLARNQPEPRDHQHIRHIYQQLKTLPLDQRYVASVNNFILKKERARIALESGSLYLAKPIDGKITAAVFLGSGRFQLNPPDETDRYQVKRFTETDSIDAAFTAAYFLFTDSTANQLKHELPFRDGKISPEAGNLHKTISKLLQQRGQNLANAVLSDLVNKSANGFFLALFQQGGDHFNFPSYLIFYYDTRSLEAVSAYQYFPNRINKPFYTLCSFNPKQVRPISVPVPSGPLSEDGLKIRHYKMSLNLSKNGRVQAQAELSFTPTINKIAYLTLELFQKLKIDSVKTIEGDTLFFIKEKKQASFSVLRDLPLSENKLIVYYSGKMLEPSDSGIWFLKNNQYWLPRLGYLEPATYDLTFKVPDKLWAVSTGRLVKKWHENNHTWFHWVNSTPMFGSAFELGIFDSTRFRQDDVFLTVYSGKGRSRHIRKEIAGDVGNGLYLFQQYFGGKIDRRLAVVESPLRTSFGYPGMLFLSATSFATAAKGVMESHRGHETAHQWWGNLVGWKTYHDQWLSEGLAEYSGALLNEFLFNGADVFFETMNGWRNDLLEKGHIGVSVGLRSFGFSKADLTQSDGLLAGPIWLGRRLGEKHAVDYFLLVYEKGAFVIHMLRTMLRDFTTGSDETFFRMLTDYAQTFQYAKAGTADFQRIAEKYAGESLDWFFQQWVFGVDVPTYYYSDKVEKDESAFWATLTVRQKDVPPEFKAVIPVTIQLNKKNTVTRKIMMTDAEKTFRLGPFDSAPEKVIFNDFQGVLARVKKQ